MKFSQACAYFLLVSFSVLCTPPASTQTAPSTAWKHLSSGNGDLDPPSSSQQQTASLVLDVDGDEVNDFVIACRRGAPAMVWYRRTAEGWTKYAIENSELDIEAGGAVHDIDSDGDLDIVMGGDGRSSEVWWWENPSPDFEPSKPWKRRVIKDSGATKHHDQTFGDFDGDGRAELVFWNQGAQTLFSAEIPENPHDSGPWPLMSIYAYRPEDEPQQRGTYPGWKRPNEHEGLAMADIDGDGKLDIVGGGRWFRHEEGSKFSVHVIDGSYTFSRAAAGELKNGGRPEIVLVVGDGIGPLIWYEWVKGSWEPHTLSEDIDNGHTLQIIDLDGDGNLDIFHAEMRLQGGNEDALMRVFLGNGRAEFTEQVIAAGYGNHESRAADLDGDGDIDILGKPYAWETPRVDIWLSQPSSR